MRLLVLGSGWIGGALLERHPDAHGTSRVDGRHPRFVLEERDTWSDLPDHDAVVWTFPATVPDAAMALRPRLRGPLVVLGSMGSLVAPAADAWVDEATPLDRSQPRVVGEEVLRWSGATVLHLAGLWGPGRDPVDWLRAGRIRDGRRFVNLIHRDDVLDTIEAVIRDPLPGARVCVADGAPRRWNEHVADLVAAGRLPRGFQLGAVEDRLSYRVRADRLRAIRPGWTPRGLTGPNAEPS